MSRKRKILYAAMEEENYNFSNKSGHHTVWVVSGAVRNRLGCYAQDVIRSLGIRAHNLLIFTAILDFLFLWCMGRPIFAEAFDYPLRYSYRRYNAGTCPIDANH